MSNASGYCGPKQPGGAMTRASAKKDAVASPRLSYKGGNPARKNMIPNNERK